MISQAATSLATRLKRQARALGFDLAGIAAAAPADGFAHLTDWLAQGFAGEMHYMHRHHDARREPAAVLTDVRSVVMVAMNYAPPAADPPIGECHGKVAHYAAAGITTMSCAASCMTCWRGCKPSGPARRGAAWWTPPRSWNATSPAVPAWAGSARTRCSSTSGSAATPCSAPLARLRLDPDEPFATNHCGSCTRCLDACPTDAFAGPFRLDARRCISYLTIELRGAIPTELRSGVGEWVFGCDVCQEVCPWNRKAPPGTEPALAPAAVGAALDLVELLGLSDDAFRRRFRDTALWRSRRRGLLRNAAIVLGNRGDARRCRRWNGR